MVPFGDLRGRLYFRLMCSGRSGQDIVVEAVYCTMAAKFGGTIM